MTASDTPAGTPICPQEPETPAGTPSRVCYVEAGSQKNVSILYILREGKTGAERGAYDDLDFRIFRAVSNYID